MTPDRRVGGGRQRREGERKKEREKEREEKKNDGEWRRGKAGPFNGQLKLEKAPRYFFFLLPSWIRLVGKKIDGKLEVRNWRLGKVGSRSGWSKYSLFS